MKILITGGSGLIGQYLNIELSKHHEILTLFNKHEGNCKEYSFSKLDITDNDKLQAVFKAFGPQVVIHTAAVSSPAQADRLLPERVEDININTTKFLAELCHQTKTKLLYFSTDLVYDGDQSSYLTESAKLNPLSLYAKTKLEGERAIKNTFFNYVIVRHALTFGYGLHHSTNHFMQTICRLKEGEKVSLYTDQFRSPVSLNDSARMIRELLEKDIRGEIINLGGNRKLSRYELVEIAVERLGLNKDMLKKSKMESSNLKYKVKDVSLNIDKLKSYGIVPKSLEESIDEFAGMFKD